MIVLLIIISISGCIHRNTVTDNPVPYHQNPAPHYAVIEKGCFHQFDWAHEWVIESTCTIKK